MLEIWRDLTGHLLYMMKKPYEMENFIEMLYGIGIYEDRKTRISSPELAKDLIEGILLKIKDKTDFDVSYLYLLCDSTEDFIRGNIVLLYMMHCMLCSKDKTADSIEFLVETMVASGKEHMFRMTITSDGNENDDALGNWKYRLGDEIGLNGMYEQEKYIYDQDPFKNNDEDVLETFYSKFTSEYMIESLVKIINVSKDKIEKAKLLLESEAKDMESKERMFDFEDNKAVEDFKPKSIKPDGVKEILLKMNILKRKKETEEEKHDDDGYFLNPLRRLWNMVRLW